MATFRARLLEIQHALPFSHNHELKDIISEVLLRITTVASDLDSRRHVNDTTTGNATRARVLLCGLETLQHNKHLEVPGGDRCCQVTLDVLNDMLAEIYRVVPAGRYFQHGLRAQILQAQNEEYCRSGVWESGLAQARHTACDTLVDLAFYVEQYGRLRFDSATKLQLLEEKAKLMFESHFIMSQRYNTDNQEDIIRQNVLALGRDMGWNIVYRMLYPDARVRIGLVAGPRQ